MRAVAKARVVARAVARAEARAVVRVVAVAVVMARCILFSLIATGIRGDIVCHATLAIGVAVFLPRHFGNTRRCHLPLYHSNAWRTQ
jgi:hypothetical protein